MRLSFLKKPLFIPDYTGLIIFDEYGNRVNTDTSENPEQVLAKTYINPYATVLELGARYGSVSCTINKKIVNKQNQVSVEPDESVWDVLEKNIHVNKCSIRLHKGIISKKSYSIIKEGYSTHVVPSENTSTNAISVEELQTKYGLAFDTLVADCEGFLESFFDDHPFLYQQLHTVIFEADSPDRCDYEKIRAALKENGFLEILCGFQNVYIKV